MYRLIFTALSIISLSILLAFPCVVSGEDELLSQQQLNAQIKAIKADQMSKPNQLILQLDTLIRLAQDQSLQGITVKAQAAKVEFLIKLEEIDAADKLIEQYLPIAQRLKDKASELTFLSSMLNITEYTENAERAELYRQRLHTQLKSYNSDELLAEAYLAIGQSQDWFGEKKKGLLNLQKALTLAEKINNKSKIEIALAAIGNLYGALQEHEQAIEYHLKALDLSRELNDRYAESVNLFNAGESYFNLKQMKDAEIYLAEAKKVSEEILDVVGVAYAEHALGDIYFEQGDHLAAKNLFLSARLIFQEKNSKRRLFQTSTSAIDAMLTLNQVAEARAMTQGLLALANDIGSGTSLSDYYLRVYQIEKSDHKIAEALAAFELYNKQLIRQHQIEKEKSVKELMIKFDTDRKTVENNLLQKENELKQLRLNEQGKQRIIWKLSVGLLLLFVLLGSYALYNQVKKRKRFHRLSMRDELTGSPNRRAILELAQQHLETCKNIPSQMIIALVDLDHFKQINDTYGHDIGDKVLKEFSRLCQQALRSHDAFGRYGGEEWLLVLPDADNLAINHIFKRLSESLANTPINGLPENYPVTFSLGAAKFNQEENTLEQLLKRADINLYAAKEAGRNQFVV